MAAGYFKHLIDENGPDDVEVLSAGTFAGDGEPPSRQSAQSMRKIGIDISNHKSTPLTRELLESADIIITMTASHKRTVGSISPSSMPKTRILGELSNQNKDIADPFGGDADIYDNCLKSMIPPLEALHDEIKSKSVKKTNDKNTQ
jgi:protein-tyrosine-phosphatase